MVESVLLFGFVFGVFAIAIACYLVFAIVDWLKRH